MNNKTLKRVLTFLSFAVGAYMILASYPKLMATTQLLENFEKWGLPSWFHYPVGIIELVGGAGLFFPKTRRFAALCIAMVMLGAVYVHVAVDKEALHAIPAFGVIVACGIIIYLSNRLSRS